MQPHGVEATTRVGSEAITGGAAVNPDCIASEGPCVATSGK